MLKEIVCSKFKQGRIEFHKGLNVVLGDELGSNSIGKSTFLMIIDYVYGGKDYVMKSTDVQRNVGNHIIKFAFSFENKMYYFSRNTNDTEFVDVCDEQYNITDRIPIEQYTDKLKKLYGFEEKEVKFRDVVGRYTRVYGKENLNEKRPLDVVHNEKAGQPINALLKLCGLYGAIQELEELAREKSAKYMAFKNAQDYQFISNIKVKQRKGNDKLIDKLEEEKETIAYELSNNLLDMDSEKAGMILSLKRELAEYNRKLRLQNSKLQSLQDNLQGNRIINESDLADLKDFFPEIKLRRLEEIQKFHIEIDSVLKQEILEEIQHIESFIELLQQNKEQVEKKIKEISEIPNLSRTILFKFAEIQKEIEELESQNNYYDNRVILHKEKQDADARKDIMRSQQLAQLQNMLNIEMAKLNNEIYNGEKIPPTISFNKNQYIFETVDDTGTGTCYRGVILFDLSIMKLTCLPFLVHDSVLLKQIEDVAIEKILELYNASEKQVFIALDKVWSYSERSQAILKSNRVLQLGTNGDELFGRSWSKK